MQKRTTVRHSAATIALAFAATVGWSALSTCSAAASSTASIGKFQRVAEPAAEQNKPATFFFMSALFCPYCAAERWAIVEALDRFGSWSNLGQATSSNGIDGFSALPTYDFLHGRYASRFVSFEARDIADAQGHPLQQLNSTETTAVNRYDPKGGFPFLFIDGAFVQLDSGYSPGLLSRETFAGVQDALKRRTPLGQAIKHEADILTALVCIGDGERPTRVCNTHAVQLLAAQAR